MKVYLDTSVYNRPFDDQTQPRIWLETLAFAVILQMIEAGNVELVTSSVVEYENSRNPSAMRRKWVARCVRLATASQDVNPAIRERAQELEEQRVKALDALHIASAETAGAEHFMTCDDQLIRRYTGKLTALNPIDFVRRMEDGDG